MGPVKESASSQQARNDAVAEPQEPVLALTPNALRVLEKRYLRKDDAGHPIEQPEEMFKRVAHNIASADERYNPEADVEELARTFYRLMASLEFLPNSPTLMNAGRELQQLSACFVLPVEDSMESIFDAIKATALIHKSGGGTGFSFSRLRPKNDIVRSTKGVASGPVSFMRVFDAATEAVKQGGTRRGANMGILSVEHPDIIDFIEAKRANQGLENFNISVAVTEKFMEAVERDEEYDLVSPRYGQLVARQSAREVFNLMIDGAWQNGDPGIIFIDRINRDNPTPHVGSMESTNPCGEQPLLPYESCNLGSMNLSKFVRPDRTIDWEHMREVIHLAVHFLDNVIDVNHYPVDEIGAATRNNRKIGLGVMGFADFLIQLGISYDSDEAVSLAEQLMGFIQRESKAASVNLAQVRGAFPSFKGSAYDTEGGMLVRNATTTTIAPTGTLSIIAGCSSGIEPLFALSYFRKVLDNEKLVEANPLFERVARETGFYSDELMQEVAEKGGLAEIEDLPEWAKRIFITSHDVSPLWHIKMQGAFQGYVDNAVSKTVNFSHDATPEDVEEVFMLAYRLGCKGVTIYRDRSRDEQVLNIGSSDDKLSPEQPAADEGLSYIQPQPRPLTTHGSTTQIKTGCGSLYVTINEDERGRAFEVFSNMGKAGGCEASQTEATSRLISQALRSGLDPRGVVKQLIGIRCNKPFGMGKNAVYSCPDAIAKVILTYLDSLPADRRPEFASAVEATPQAVADTQPVLEQLASMLFTDEENMQKNIFSCPDCGCELEISEGCEKCNFCGYSECS